MWLARPTAALTGALALDRHLAADTHVGSSPAAPLAVGAAVVAVLVAAGAVVLRRWRRTGP